MNSNNAIHINNLSISYGASTILTDINMLIQPHLITAIMGPSGSGKTSILNTLSAQNMNFSGNISIHNQSLQTFSAKQLLAYRLNCGIVFQNHALMLNLTVFENVALPLRYHFNYTESDIQSRVLEVLENVNLREFADYLPEQLSGGMAKRAALARSIILKPQYLFFDEPFSGQDPLTTQRLANLITDLCRDHQITTVMITHEVNATLALADHIYLLDSGQIAAEGPPKTIRSCTKPFVRAFIQNAEKSG